MVLCCGEDGLGELEGRRNITGERFWDTEVRPIFGFCSSLTGGKMDEGGVQSCFPGHSVFLAQAMSSLRGL